VFRFVCSRDHVDLDLCVDNDGRPRDPNMRNQYQSVVKELEYFSPEPGIRVAYYEWDFSRMICPSSGGACEAYWIVVDELGVPIYVEPERIHQSWSRKYFL
jgi:hypothetical protein